MRHVAIVGTGQTPCQSSRQDVNWPELIYEAVCAALNDCELSLAQIDAVVFGSSPEMFLGVNAPEKWAASASGGYLKPQFRIHTGGTVGSSTGIAAFYLVASGAFDVVLAVTGDKLSEGNVTAALSAATDPIYMREFLAGAASIVSQQALLYLHKYGYTEEHGAKVAVKNRRNALNNPFAQLHMHITVEDVLNSPVISYPLKQLDCCPTSDGAAAMILACEEQAPRICPRPAWVRGVAAIAEGINYKDRDLTDPLALREAAKKAYRQAGITNPRQELDVAEVYEAFSFQEMIWYEGLGFCERGEGGKMIDQGVTEMGGELPVNPSGGVLSANTIGSAAMVRQIEAALQVMKKAERRQVPDAKLALAHGFGGFIQFHNVMILAGER